MRNSYEGTDDFPAFEAVATSSPSFTGTFSDAYTATGTTTGEGVCEGEQCDGVIAALGTQNNIDLVTPCSSTVPFEMSAVTA